MASPSGPAPTRACTIEGLESRVVLSAGPVVTGVELLGRVTAINAVVLTFNESLDPASAQRVASYAFGRPPVAPDNSSDFSIGDLFNPFRETNPPEAAHLRPRPRLYLVRQDHFHVGGSTTMRTTP